MVVLGILFLTVLGTFLGLLMINSHTAILVAQQQQQTTYYKFRRPSFS